MAANLMRFTPHFVFVASGILHAVNAGRGEKLRVLSFNIRGATWGFDPFDPWVWLNLNDPDQLLDGLHHRDRGLAVFSDDSPEILDVEELNLDQRNGISNAFP